jgi:hypothetical protein
MATNEFLSEKLGNKIFALETNLFTAKTRLWNFYYAPNDSISSSVFDSLILPLNAIEESIEQLKAIKKELENGNQSETT